MNSFWLNLKKPFFALAPMEDVTDTVFREIIMSVAGTNVLQVVFTEFTSTDGLMNSRGYERVSERLVVNQSELNILKSRNTKLVAQIWGNNPEKFYKTAQLISEMNVFDGVDINMGCPVKKVVKKNTCSALIKEPKLAREIILATKEGTTMPVSVKTRIGFNSVVTEEWSTELLEADIAALTLHGRTQKMQSDGLADWSEIAKAVKVRNRLKKETVIIGNGDIDDYYSGYKKFADYDIEGIMVGRGVFKNPWMFRDNDFTPSLSNRFELLERHIKLYEATWKNKKNFNVLKRFFKIYVSNFRDAGTLRAKLMETTDYAEALRIIENAQSVEYQS